MLCNSLRHIRNTIYMMWLWFRGPFTPEMMFSDTAVGLRDLSNHLSRLYAFYLSQYWMSLHLPSWLKPSVPNHRLTGSMGLISNDECSDTSTGLLRTNFRSRNVFLLLYDEMLTVLSISALATELKRLV